MREARRRDASFDPDSEQRRTIATICDRCDRIPLAIELAAAHATAFGPATILQRLDQFLTTRRVGRARSDSNTMSDAIDWSIDLLDPETAAALGALATFAGSFDTTAAEALISVVTDASAEDVIERLAELSLLECREGPRHDRHRLLEPVRQRARPRLVVDEASLRHRHLDHYLDTLEAAYLALGSSSSDPIIQLVQQDLDNLGAAHSWALASGRLEDDLRLYRPLTPLVLWHEVLPPRQWALEILAFPEVRRLKGFPDAVTAAAIGHFDGPADRDFAEEIRTLYERAESMDPADRGRSLQLLGAVWMDSLAGDRVRAAKVWETVDLDDPHAHFLYWFIGCFARSLPSADVAATARKDLSAGIHWARSVNAENFEAALVGTMAELEVVFGDPQLGYETALRAESMAARIDMRFAAAEALRFQALAALHGAVTEKPASVLFREILVTALRRRSGARAVFALNGVAFLFARLGHDDAAALASHIVDRTYEIRLPDLDRISADTRRSAALRAESGLDVFDIVEESIRTLDRIIESEQSTRPSQNGSGDSQPGRAVR